MNTPPGEWIEWGVLRTWGPATGEVATFERDRRTAEKCAREWPGVLVSRTVVAHPWTALVAPPKSGYPDA